jgi:predicted transcriptional regulator
MSDENKIPPANEEIDTVRFLKTNGPSKGAFKPEIPEHLLKGKSESEKWLYEMVSIGAKQNEWLIKQVAGLKGAHRSIHAKLVEGDNRFQTIEVSLDESKRAREVWTSRKNMVRNVTIAICSLLLLPFISTMAVEYIKHHFHWGP